MAGAPREEEARGQGRTLASGRGIWPNPQTGVSPGGGGGSWSLRPAAAAAPPLQGHHSAAVLEGRAGCKAAFFSSGPSAAPRWEHNWAPRKHLGLHQMPRNTGVPLRQTTCSSRGRQATAGDKCLMSEPAWPWKAETAGSSISLVPTHLSRPPRTACPGGGAAWPPENALAAPRTHGT